MTGDLARVAPRPRNPPTGYSPAGTPAGSPPPWLIALALVAGVVVWHWTAPLAVLLLWAIWHYPRRLGGAPVASLALTYQWIQATSGLFFFGILDHDVLKSYSFPSTYPPTDVRLMIALALASIAVLLVGVVVGQRDSIRHLGRQRTGTHRIGLLPLWIVFVALLLASGALQRLAWSLGGLTQVILTLNLVRMAVLFMLFRRLLHPRVHAPAVALLIIAELVVGVSGFFADFLRSQIMLALAIAERFDVQRRRHWAMAIAAGLVLVASTTVWTAVKTEYRSQVRADMEFAGSGQDRVSFVFGQARDAVGRGAAALDPAFRQLVNRSWAVYLPAHALERVPAVTPHENGRILWSAIQNILMPRIVFTDKPEMPSSSELVRKYSGVWVAGREMQTSYAFGYAIESYVDFGLPFMFIPILLFGLAIGFVHRKLMTGLADPEIAAAAAAVIVWRALYLFEESWIMKIGNSITTFIVVAGCAWLADYLLRQRSATQRTRRVRLEVLEPGRTAVVPPRQGRPS
jgi:hypothetical protein